MFLKICNGPEDDDPGEPVYTALELKDVPTNQSAEQSIRNSEPNRVPW